MKHGRIGLVATAALLAMITLAGCAHSSKGAAMTVDEARAAAVKELRSVVALGGADWPGVPDPAVNDCSVDGAKGVQFTYFVAVKKPKDPKSLVDTAARFWKEHGYTVERSSNSIGGEAGTEYTANASADGKPHPSIGATNLLAHIYVDSVCVKGDPDDYR
jgi:uncharacterized lipoprotein